MKAKRGRGAKKGGLGKETLGGKPRGLYDRYFNESVRSKTLKEKIRFEIKQLGIHVGEIYLVLISLILWSGFIALLVGYWDKFLILAMVLLGISGFVINEYVKRDKLLGYTRLSKFKKGLHVVGILICLMVSIIFVNDNVRYTKLAFNVQENSGLKTYTHVHRCSGYGHINRCVQDKEGTIRVYTTREGLGKEVKGDEGRKPVNGEKNKDDD